MAQYLPQSIISTSYGLQILHNLKEDHCRCTPLLTEQARLPTRLKDNSAVPTVTPATGVLGLVLIAINSQTSAFFLPAAPSTRLGAVVVEMLGGGKHSLLLTRPIDSSLFSEYQV